MNSPLNKALTAAVLRLLRPLVRILLRNGVPYGSFADLAKWVYVDMADKEFPPPGRKQSVSRVSVLTGLSRKEVSRLQAIAAEDDSAVARQYNRAARVVTGWVRDPDYRDRKGEPLPLPMEGTGTSFTALVRHYSGDIPARAVLDELLRVGAVEQDARGWIRLREHGYIPRTGEADKLHILGSDVADLIHTIDHNLQHGQDNPLYQRKLAYDNLPAEVLPQLRQLSADKAQALLEELDRWLSRHDRDVNPHAQGTGRKRAGLSIYYFEQDYSEDDRDETQ